MSQRRQREEQEEELEEEQVDKNTRFIVIFHLCVCVEAMAAVPARTLSR